MVKRYAEFQGIDRKETITSQTHYEFWCHLEHALLLALREQGRLSPMQYRYAEERLRQQRQKRAKLKQEEL